MKLIVLVSISTLLFATGCISIGERVNGNGHLTTEKRTIHNAEKIRLTGSIDVILDSGDAAVKVEADENIIPYITTDDNDNRLDIGTKDNVNINTTNPVRVYVTSPAYTNITVTGSGNVTAKRQMWSDKPVTLAVTGSGDITLAVNAPAVKAGITGSGNINLTGQAKDVDVNVTGSGNFKGMQLSADNAKVNIAGSGDVALVANTTLDATVLGSGDVKYKGNASVHKNIAGSGSVDKAE